MGETFYSALGVGTDADREAIQCAYRDQIKETHPDVSDRPDAADQFKQLTTARDVLVDERERRRYDRLGHAAYVDQHVSDSAWTTDGTDGGTAAATARRTDSGTETTAAADRATRASNPADSRTRDRDPTRASGRSRSHSRSGASGRYGRANWQTASEAYTRTPMDVDVGQPSALDRLIAAVQALGPWLVVYLVLVLSAIATGWFFYATSVYVGATTPALVAGLVVVVLVIWLSLLHMLTELYV